jgi:hypothetical protein
MRGYWWKHSQMLHELSEPTELELASFITWRTSVLSRWREATLSSLQRAIDEPNAISLSCWQSCHTLGS